MAWFTGVVPVDDHQVLDMARNALRNGVSADTLISEWFDDSGKFKRKYSSTPPRSGPWDESAFAAGRDGESNNAGISFNVEGPEMAVIQGVTPPPDNNWPPSGAPSRPPSRANNVSPLGRVVDWTASAASGTVCPSNEKTSLANRCSRPTERRRRATRTSPERIRRRRGRKATRDIQRGKQCHDAAGGHERRFFRVGDATSRIGDHQWQLQRSGELWPC